MTTTYDVIRDFNTTGIQPASGDPFTYATETSLNVGFMLLPYYGNTSSSVGGNSTTTDGTVNNYYFAQPFQFSGPSIGVVATGGTLTFPSVVPLIVPDDVLVMMAGSPDLNAPDLIVTRFNAPSAGVFDITGSFADLQMASVDLTIVVDGTTVFSSSFSGHSPNQGPIPFSIAGISLDAGQSVDFVVDSLGSQAFDCVGLTALITETLVNEAPTTVALANATASLAENASTASHIKVADITVTDDALGSNTLALTGADAGAFEIIGTELFLKAGTLLDFESKMSYAVAVTVDDPTVGVTPDATSTTYSLAIANVSGVTINGTSGNNTINATTTVAGQPLPTNEEDTIHGGAGKDTINALGGNDLIDGGAGADTMFGGTGNDTYVVDNSGDVVNETGGNGSDLVQSSITFSLSDATQAIGAIENLTLTGMAKINGTGNALANEIIGNSGSNILNGLGGADILTGGQGSDKFVFTALAHSTPNASDLITDFVTGSDIFDFSTIDANTSKGGNQAFAYGGQNANVVANSVTWVESNGNTIVQADANGDTTADLQIVLLGTNLHLHATDFIL